MERLTEKVNDYWKTNDKAHIYYLDTNESVFVGNVIDRLAEFEDFMEEMGFESLEELKLLIIKSKDAISYSPTRVKTIEVFREMFYDYDQQNIDPPSIRDLNKENQVLKDRWEKFKEFINEDKHYELVTQDVAYGYKNCILSINNKIQELEKGE